VGGNPGVGSLHAFRRAVEGGTLEIEEYSHFGMVARFSAGAARLPFWTLRDYTGTDLPRANPRIKSVTCPYTGETLATVPALNPDVTIVHAQRADAQGNAQIWGLLGVQKEAAFASQARHRRGGRIGGGARDPIGSQSDADSGGHRERRGGRAMGRASVLRAGLLRPRQRFLCRLGDDSRDRTELAHYLDEFVYGVQGRAEYMEKQPSSRSAQGVRAVQRRSELAASDFHAR